MSPPKISKTYQPAQIETRLYEKWEASGAFRARAKPAGEPYCIMMPPPNVTGRLHMGHALNTALQDVLIRFERMRGRDVLWQPGTDHAGIATQAVVEKQIMAEGNISRMDMGRENFVERIWRWKEKSGDDILQQLRRLGASCDWSLSRFTLDEGMSRAVREAFVALYRDGLIYRDKRLVNWDPKLLTAISDLEVDQRDVQGHLWHFLYPFESGADAITIATTRPETMLGDVAVAVHPGDERYRDFVGRKIKLPLTGRLIPVIADEYADPQQGSGAVKITPAHDFNDFEVGRRHGLAMINILEPDGAIIGHGMTQSEAQKIGIPDRYWGLTRDHARALAVKDMDEAGLLVQTEDHLHAVPYGDRSNEVIEPYLTDQWYVDAVKLAEPAIAAVERGQTKFVPANWEKTYFDWMRNIQPWCISRQLWWGHRIPVWYGPDGAHFAAHDEADAQAQARAHYGRDEALQQDEDVLDTWFSSGLWPFSTLGWPDQTERLGRYFPTQILVTGFDIIFFWVARMMMMSLYFMNKAPFDAVYIHALVRDERGQKMTKSRGNVIDPLELIDEYGADALRMTMIIMAAQGRDVKLSRARVAGYRNFATKLWNAARFCEMNDCVEPEGFDPAQVRAAHNQWIIFKLEEAHKSITDGLAHYHFNRAADAAYHFVWHIFCDWFVEFAKLSFQGSDEAVKAETQAVAGWVLNQTLRLLHPFMPFITEALWEKITPEGEMLILADWPDLNTLSDEVPGVFIERTFLLPAIERLVSLISEIRSVRSEMNVPAAARIEAVMVGAPDFVEMHRATIESMARLSKIEVGERIPENSVQILLDDATLYLQLAGIVDLAAEADRLRKEISKTESEMAKLKLKLDNEDFLSRAPYHVVEDIRMRLETSKAACIRLKDALKRIG